MRIAGHWRWSGELRDAFGASEKQVLIQCLVEAIVLSMIGGTLGMKNYEFAVASAMGPSVCRHNSMQVEGVVQDRGPLHQCLKL